MMKPKVKQIPVMIAVMKVNGVPAEKIQIDPIRKD